MSVINSQPLIGASGNQGGAYNIERSLRFRNSASAYLNRTPSSATNQQKWTWSGWIKPSLLNASSVGIFEAASNSSNRAVITIPTTQALQVYFASGGSTICNLVSTVVFRDPAAWYHFVIAVDTTQATDTNRVKIYVNGSQITSFSTATYPTQNFNTQINSTVSHVIGAATPYSVGYYFDGYQTEINFIDGQALTPSSFGETDTITGVWKPKKYTGTYGTNGFYLQFNTLTSTSTLGNDSSGNSNTWTVNNISLTAGVTYDSMTDVPTLTSATAANYAVLNQISKTSNITVSDGNLNVSAPSSGGVTAAVVATMYPANGGKYYYEFIPSINTSGNNNIYLALAPDNFPPTASDVRTSMLAYHMNPSGVNAGQVIGITIDRVNNEQKLYLDNVFQSTVSIPANVNMEIYFGLYQLTGNFNFGQRPFAYTPPSGYVALNTYNLPDSTIVAGNKVMDANLWTGNSSARSITNSGGFKPDLIWVKSRSTNWSHALTDSVRGNTKFLQSNKTDAEQDAGTAGITSFNSNGFSEGDGGLFNNSGDTYVGWQWQAGQGTTSTNTSGSITSTVSANTTAGFSIVTYTGTGANATVGHGLGVAPSMVIVRNRSITQNFVIGHTSVWNSNLNSFLLFTASATSTNSTIWNGARPTSTTISIGSDSGTNGNGNSMLAYCWSEVAGFSKFGSYTGNGSTDGTFVYTGFRPKFLLIKNTGTTNDWAMFDSTREPSNVMIAGLKPNTADAEYSGFNTRDFLSNGFKFRNADADVNGSGANYIYMAFAENPFKNSLAR